MNALIFEADYSRSMDTVAARIARGKADGELRLQPKPSFDFDTMAHTVRGLTVGEGAASVTYETANNLAPDRGTIELTVKPQDWNGNGSQLLMLMQTVIGGKTPLGKLFIYKYKATGIAAYFEFSDQGENVFLKQAIPAWEAGTWHHLALTYDLPGRLRWFVDGVAADEALVATNPAWPERFAVGSLSEKFGGSGGRTTIGVVAAYNRAMSDADIAALAKRRLPDLDIAAPTDPAGATTGQEYVPRSRWHENGRPRLGLDALDDNTVLPPWTALTMQGTSVSVWERRYDFAGPNLLASVSSTNAELLAGPLRMTVGPDGTAPLAFGRLTPPDPPTAARVRLTRNVSGPAGITGKLDILAEVDGLLWFDLALNADDPAVLSRLTLTVPLREETAQFIHYVGAPHAYESQDLPRNSFSRALAPDAGTLFESGFRTTIWIGNNRRGLLWCAESDRGWWPKDRPDAIRIVRKSDGTAELIIAAVGAEAPGDSRVRLRFGIMATPVKPMPAGWRAWTFSAQYDGIRGERRGSHLIYWPDQWRAMKLDPDPTRALDLETNRARNAADHAAGRKIIPYWTRLHVTARDGESVEPDAAWMLDRWSTTPNRPGGGSHQFFRCATTTGWADYLVWCVEEWARVMGHLDGVYIDETQPIPNTRAESGGGYDAPDGTRRPTFEFFGSRHMHQRMMWNTLQRNGEPAVSVAHCSATHTMQCLSMFPVMLIGEQYYSGYFKDNPEFLPPENDRLYYYSYALPIDRMRAECYWKQWGAVMLWLPCLKNQKDIMQNPVTTRDMLSRVMQADMLVWPLFCNTDEVLKTWRFREEFGVGDPKVTFTPYWENDRIETGRDGVVAGYYSRDNDMLVIISNLNRRNETVRLQLAQGRIQNAQNAESGQTIETDGTGFSFTLPRNDYTAVRLTTTGAQ